MATKKFTTHRVLIVTSLLTLLIIGAYIAFIYHPSSPQFREIEHQAAILQLPRPDIRNSIGDGCKQPQSEGLQCYRDLSLSYKNVSLETNIKQSLLQHGWTFKRDATGLTGQDFDQTLPIHTVTWNLYTKNVSNDKLCAIVRTEYNANYKRNAPWLVDLYLFDNLEKCNQY